MKKGQPTFFFFPFQTLKAASGIKPCLVISGDFFEDSDDNRRIKSLLIGMVYHSLFSHYFL